MRERCLLTETVQLDPRRNPYADKLRVEAEMVRTIGATHAIWLPRGLTRDYDDLGTNGHVDIVATIPSPGRLLVHAQTDPAHPDHQVTGNCEPPWRPRRTPRDATGTSSTCPHPPPFATPTVSSIGVTSTTTSSTTA